MPSSWNPVHPDVIIGMNGRMDMTSLRILVTGGTGFLGKRVIPELQKLGGKNAKIDCISRTQLGCIRGDLTLWDAHMNPESLRDQYDVFLHMAGLYDLRSSFSDAMKHNVTATHNALVIAQKAHIPHFVNISSVAVTVGEKGQASERDLKRVGLDPNDPLIYPDILDTSRSFPDNYAKTKANAEHLVKHWPTADFKSRLNLRLGILIGDQENGIIERIDGPYHIPEFLQHSRSLIEKMHGQLPFPGSPKIHLPLVPVDVAAQAIAKLIGMTLDESWEDYRSLHLAPNNGPKIQEIYESAMKELGMAPITLRLSNGIPKTLVKYVGEWISDIPKEELEYILSLPRLHVAETERLLGRNWCPEFKSYESAFWKGYHEYVSHR